MKITKSKLKQIIKEELSRVVREQHATDEEASVELLEKHGPKWVREYYNEYLDISQYYNKIAKESDYHLKINVGFEVFKPNYVADGAENTYNWHVYYTIKAQDKNGDDMLYHQGYPLDGRTEYGATFDTEGKLSGWTPYMDQTHNPTEMEDQLGESLSQLQRADRYEYE